MGNKKVSNRAAPKVSSATSLSAGATTHKTNPSSIIRSAFSPSRFQLSLFASVIQGLDSHQLRVHDTISGRLKCEHSVSRAKISSLDWGYYGSDPQSLDGLPAKKRKKRAVEESNGIVRRRGDVVIGFGTDAAEIHLYSLAAAKILATLKGGHTQGIADFKFKKYGLESEGWSIGNDKKLVQWNLKDGIVARSIALAIPSSESLSSMLLLPASVLIASNVAYKVGLHGQDKTQEVGEEISSIHSMFAEYPEEQYDDPRRFLTALVAERYLNVRDTTTGELIGSLVAGGDVQSIATDETEDVGHSNVHSRQVLAAVTTNAEIELFRAPLVFETQGKDGESLKSKLKQKTRKHSAKIKIIRPDQRSTTVPLVAIAVQENEIVIAHQEASGHLGFERVTWRKNEGEGLALHGDVILTKAKTLLGLEKETVNGVKDMGRTHVDESKAVISRGEEEPDAMELYPPEVIDISSAEEGDSDSENEEPVMHSPPAKLVRKAGSEGTAVQPPPTARASKNDPEDGSDINDHDKDDGEPSFGELLRAKASETIDVAASVPDRQQQSVVPHGKGATNTPSGMTLGAVLSQSLRTNDVSLLETCFHERDLNVVRATIERLDSTLAATLLQRLAERLHNRPGRAGSLMVWIQWTLVAHGGHLGAQPDIVKKLAALHSVIKERANSLQPLLALKGKLDMLEAQMNLRRSMNSRYGLGDTANDEDNEAVIYVEGQDDLSGSDDEQEAVDGLSKRETALQDIDDDSDSDDEAMPDAIGGFEGETDEDEEDDTSEDGAGGLIDDEASETDDDEGDDEAIDYDDVDSADEDESESEEDALAPSKLGTTKPLTNGVSGKKDKDTGKH